MAISFVKSFSLVSSPDRVGYQNKIGQPDTVSDTEDDGHVALAVDKDVAFNMFDSGSNISSYKPQYGEAFSMLTPSMWPQDMLAALSQPEDSQPPFQFDAFGFISEDVIKAIHDDPSRENEDDVASSGDEECGGVRTGDTEVAAAQEDKLRTKWIAYLEFNYNESATPRMKWSQVEAHIRHTKVLDELVKGGLPHSMRTQLWLRFSNGILLKSRSKWTYADMCEQSSHVDALSDELISRIMPSNACFTKSSSVGIERLRRLLRVIKWLQRSGSNPLSSQETVNVPLIAAYLLLVCDEEDAFWLVLSCVSELKNFSHQSVLKYYLGNYCPEADAILKSNDIEISLITSHWFSSIFATFIPNTSLLYRFWDLYFYYGPVVLFQLTIGLIIDKTNSITKSELDSAAIFNTLSDLPSSIIKAKHLLKYWTKGQELVHHIKLSNNLESLTGTSSVPRSTSLITLPSFCNENSSVETTEFEIRSKNVRQTNMLHELHESIVSIGKHFESYDSDFRAILVPDFSDVDCDYEDYGYIKPRKTFRRAKALIDFQRHDPDELGFRRNDIITVISERDEHCWIGELNGLRGWFPAKFVELLDERHGDYQVAGDDKVVPFVNDLVRGRFCNAFKAILAHGLKRTIFVAMHPWNIIESIASSCIECDFNSVYSRLVLTKTFRLDEFARVLTPSEMLYRSIAHINRTHEHEPMDIKLRSLICFALNQQILHDWFTVICAMQPDIVSKYYYNWSYLASPVWRLIRAELK